MSTDEWDALLEKGVGHMRLAIKIYRLQVEGGRYFIHEHPNSASSWKLPGMVKFMNEMGMDKVAGHMCRCGMKSSDEWGEGPIKKPTGFLRNSTFGRDQLSSKCLAVTDTWPS